MLRADGYRLFRLTVSNAKRGSRAHVEKMRDAFRKKGIVLDSRGQPSMPFRYREKEPGTYEFEQVQSYNGKHAIAPPEQEDFLERFLTGEAWAGMVKSAKL